MIEAIYLKDKQRWNSVVRSMPEYDFYYLAEYHELDRTGTPLLLHYYDNNTNDRMVFPIIIRDIEGSIYKDIISVYGYAGPLSSPILLGSESIKQFQRELSDYFDAMHIVSAFSRLHPLFPWQDRLLEGKGEIKDENLTVAIDLILPPDEQRRRYARSLKTQLNRLRRKGFYVKQASSKQEVSEFVAIYYENMDRLNANPYYYFPEEYFFRFLDSIDSTLFLGYNDGKITSGSLCTLSGHIMQAHLNATRNEFLPYSPLKLVIDELRLFGNEKKMHYLHLGGGYGGDNNSLFQFKSRFSPDYYTFRTWRYVHNREEYNRLTEGKEKEPGYFPPYRYRLSL